MLEIMVVKLYCPNLHEFITVVSVYKSPSVSIRDFIADFDVILIQMNFIPKTLITGDFNVDLLRTSHDKDRICNYFESKEFYPAISGVSTNYGTQLDCVLPEIWLVHIIL